LIGSTAESEVVEVAGLDVGTWLSLMLATHQAEITERNGRKVTLLKRIEWPDGGPLLEQPSIQVDMFRVLVSEYVKEANND
jgi:hypothetical protein